VSQFEISEQARHARVMHGIAAAAGFLCRRATKP
jgi:hypothetical protein